MEMPILDITLRMPAVAASAKLRRASEGRIAGSIPLAPSAAMVRDRLEGEIGVDCVGAVSEEEAQVVHLAGVAGFRHQPGEGAGSDGQQMVVNGRHGQQRRNGGV